MHPASPPFVRQAMQWLASRRTGGPFRQTRTGLEGLSLSIQIGVTFGRVQKIDKTGACGKTRILGTIAKHPVTGYRQPSLVPKLQPLLWFPSSSLGTPLAARSPGAQAPAWEREMSLALENPHFSGGVAQAVWAM